MNITWEELQFLSSVLEKAKYNKVIALDGHP